MSKIEEKLSEMGLELPVCPAPVAAYLPVQKAGKLVYASARRHGSTVSCSMPAK